MMLILSFNACTLDVARCFLKKEQNKSKISVVFFTEALESHNYASIFYSTYKRFRFVIITKKQAPHGASNSLCLIEKGLWKIM